MSQPHAPGPFDAVSVPQGYRQLLQPVIFEPWALRLLDFADPQPGFTVLDVASGTGVVARAAATRVGPRGRVIASDISAAMLTQVQIGVDPDGAPVETLECSATAIDLPDASVDVVLCQQGFPFIRDRVAAVREMRRVLRSGGRAAAAVWLAGHRLEPFDSYGHALESAGVSEPFPDAYDSSRILMSVDDMKQVLVAGGLTDVRVTTQELEVAWASPDTAAHGISGTPFGPALATLDSQQQERIMAALRTQMSDDSGAPKRHITRAVLGRGTAG